MKKVFSVFLAVVLVLLVSQFAMAKEKKQAQKPGAVRDGIRPLHASEVN